MGLADMLAQLAAVFGGARAFLVMLGVLFSAKTFTAEAQSSQREPGTQDEEKEHSGRQHQENQATQGTQGKKKN
jgi:hypothetical protein